MRILHLCLACFYIDGYSYQENILPRINKEDGNDVMIIASTETYIDNITFGYVEPGKYVTEYGVPIIRLAYAGIGNIKIKAKIRKYVGLYEEIERFSPDVIMAHDLCFCSVKEVIRYLKKHTNVKFYADTHTAAYNSGKNWLSLNILHRLIYRHWIRKTIPYVRKYFYLSVAERDFSVNIYGFPIEKMEFYPLGGLPLPDDIYMEYRIQTRKQLKIQDKQLLFVHSGKLKSEKKTIELLKAFSSVNDLDAHLAVVGSISAEIREAFDKTIFADNRIKFYGWMNAEELQQVLCAADLYLQPGSVSATMQNATCCRCPILSYPHIEYKEGYDYGQFLWARNKVEIADVFAGIRDGKCDLNELSLRAQQCANDILDYRKLAARLYR